MKITNFIKKTFFDFLYGNRLTLVIRILLGIMFIFSAWFKIADPYSFSITLQRYNIIPEILIPYASIIIPFIELTLGLLLIAGFMTRASSFLAAMLMIVFIIAISINIFRGENFDCGCLEISRLGISENVGWPVVLRDFIFIALLYPVFTAERHILSVDTLLEKKRLNQL